MKYIASASFGKDSLAMLLRLIDEKKPLDEVIFYDTGMEFQAIYDLRDKILPLLEKNNIKYTELRPKCPFLYTMFNKPVKSRNGTCHCGYSWCGGTCRWGTTEKLQAIDKYCEEQNAICYVGIASDEHKRLSKERKQYKKFPLADWNMTEKDCLQYCREKGYSWKEYCGNGNIDLYDILDRVSCWCCRNKNLKELKNYYLYLPKYWKKLKELQLKTEMPFYKGKTKKYPNGRTIFDLEECFKSETRGLLKLKRGEEQ